MNNRLLGVVLCGGKSSRMGRDKAILLHTNGKTFLQHAIDRLQQVCEVVAISGGTIELDDVPTIRDSIDNRGPAIGIATSLKYAMANQFDACVFTPVDIPSLTVDELQKLRKSWIAGHRLTIAYSDRIEPLIGIYPVDLTDQLERIANAKDRSLFRWLQTQDHTPVPFPADRTGNINTPEDFSEYGS